MERNVAEEFKPEFAARLFATEVLIDALMMSLIAASPDRNGAAQHLQAAVRQLMERHDPTMIPPEAAATVKRIAMDYARDRIEIARALADQLQADPRGPRRGH